MARRTTSLMVILSLIARFSMRALMVSVTGTETVALRSCRPRLTSPLCRRLVGGIFRVCVIITS